MRIPRVIAAIVFASATIAGSTATSGLVLAGGSGQGHCASATSVNSDCASHGHVLADGAGSSNSNSTGTSVPNGAQPQPK